MCWPMSPIGPEKVAMKPTLTRSAAAAGVAASTSAQSTPNHPRRIVSPPWQGWIAMDRY
jgi:hypothetical protein